MSTAHLMRSSEVHDDFYEMSEKLYIIECQIIHLDDCSQQRELTEIVKCNLHVSLFSKSFNGVKSFVAECS